MAFRATSVFRQELKLRPAFEIALRTSCLQLVLARWGLETAALMGLQGERTANDDDRKVRAVDAIATAMYESGLDDHMTKAEKAMLEKPYKTWEYDDYVYGDNWEGFGVLQWLLGRQHTIPAYYSNFDRARLFQGTGIMPADPSSIEKYVDPFMSPHTHQSLDAKQLGHEVDVAEAWYWRARAQVLLNLRDEIQRAEESAQAGGGADAKSSEATPLESALHMKHIPHSLRKMANDLPKTIPLASKRAHAKGIIASIENGDFGIAVEMKDSDEGSHPKTTTVPYTSLSPEHLDAIRKIAESRFLAFAWSLGKVDQWDTDEIGNLVSINPISSLWTPNGD
ncbi:hypothetical protein GQ54DRAFT_103952 [Martensiomyces pterosporus]|nr:hypothetical protein GQ54DRAFT_103952 [Martensiomyces pterosporus]